jgi:hypothetical protein
MKKILLIMLLLFGLKLTAKVTFDTHLQGVYRSYPTGAAIEINSGAALPLWMAGGILYGYVRPSASFQTSGVTNQLRLQLDLFPISFFGFSVGMDWNKRNYEKFSTFDCDSVNCSGQVRRTFVAHKMALAYRKVFLVSSWKLERVEMTDRDGVFADVRASLLARSRYDQHLEGQMILGYKLSDKQSTGILNVYNSMKYFDNQSTMWLGVYRHEWGKYSLTSGFGFIDTRKNQKVGSALFILRWTPAKGLPLI